MKVEIYTDGACRGNPGPGGWGALIIYGEHRKEIYGYEELSTNNKMELLAVSKALNLLKKPCEVVITTDSQYVKNGIEKWIYGWKRNGWKTAAKKPVKNKEYWQKLDESIKRHKVQWQWVKGHSGQIGNERADELANMGIDKKGSNI